MIHFSLVSPWPIPINMLGTISYPINSWDIMMGTTQELDLTTDDPNLSLRRDKLGQQIW